MRASDSIESLVHGNALIYHVMRVKNLQLNEDKSNYMLIGSKDVTSKVRNDLIERSIKLANNNIKESEIEKYLGDYFHSLGNDNC